jgi:hypothetical protein
MTNSIEMADKLCDLFKPSPKTVAFFDALAEAIKEQEVEEGREQKNEGWVWDNLAERERSERKYGAMIHQQYIDSNPEFIPSCHCHQNIRRERLAR